MMKYQLESVPADKWKLSKLLSEHDSSLAKASRDAGHSSTYLYNQLRANGHITRDMAWYIRDTYGIPQEAYAPMREQLEATLKGIDLEDKEADYLQKKLVKIIAAGVYTGIKKAKGDGLI